VHDSCVAEWGNVYAKLEPGYRQHGGKCAVDTAFSSKRYPFLVKLSQNNPTAQNREEFAREVQVNAAEIPSIRQSAEWGMRAIQWSFLRLKD
jgi:hypothetical protein